MRFIPDSVLLHVVLFQHMLMLALPTLLYTMSLFQPVLMINYPTFCSVLEIHQINNTADFETL